MNRLLKNKNIFSGIFLFIVPVISAGLVVTSVVRAANSPGCYNNGQSVSCSTSPGSNDMGGNPLDPSEDCYTLAQGPVQSSSDSNWQEVSCSNLTTPVSTSQSGGPHCGSSPAVPTAIDLGCTGQGNPIMDMLFAFIRLLAAGVGIVVIASVILAGIQFSASHDDPQAKATAMKRIQASVTALFIYIFAYAILNFVIPGGFFN